MPKKGEYLDRMRRSFTIMPPGSIGGVEHDAYLIIPKTVGHKKGYKLISASDNKWKFEWMDGD